MTYQFYNLPNGPLERERKTPYLVDGKPAEVPGKVELQVIRLARPILPPWQVAEYYDTIDVAAKTRTLGYTLRDKTAEELQAEREARIPPIKNSQMRKWLNRKGKMDSVKTILRGISDPVASLDAQVDFEFETHVRRYAPLTIAVGQALWGDDAEAQLDAAFEEARQL